MGQESFARTSLRYRGRGAAYEEGILCWAIYSLVRRYIRGFLRPDNH